MKLYNHAGPGMLGVYNCNGGGVGMPFTGTIHSNKWKIKGTQTWWDNAYISNTYDASAWDFATSTYPNGYICNYGS